MAWKKLPGEDDDDPTLASNSRSNSAPGPIRLLHPFQCIARLDVSNVTGQTFLLLALDLKLYAVDCHSGQVMTCWDAEPTGSKGYISLLKVNDHYTYVAVVTSEDKAVHILSTSLTCLLLPLNKRILPKRPSCIYWAPDQKTLLAGDKFGDVYALPLHVPSTPIAAAIPEASEPQPDAAEQSVPETKVQSEENTPDPTAAADQPQPSKRFKPSATELTVHSGRNLRALENQKRTAAMKHDSRKEIDPTLTLALGHVSMLTALTTKVVAPSRAAPGADTMCRSHAQYTAWSIEASRQSRTYIITADRDEHIRISRGLPQAHIIENYCLGHTSFISALVTPDEPAGNLLFSGGGDDWIGVWDWLRGRLICRIPLAGAFAFDRGVDGKPIDAPIAVSGIWHWPVPDPLTDDWIRVAVACEGIPRLLTLTCKTLTPTSHHDFEQGAYELPGNVLDFALMNAETVVLSLDSMHERESMTEIRNLEAEKGRHPDDRCPRLFVMHINGEDGIATSTSSPDPRADTSVPFNIDSKVNVALAKRDADVVLDASKDKARLEDMMYGVEKLRKWAGEQDSI